MVAGGGLRWQGGLPVTWVAWDNGLGIVRDFALLVVVYIEVIRRRYK